MQIKSNTLEIFETTIVYVLIQCVFCMKVKNNMYYLFDCLHFGKEIKIVVWGSDEYFYTEIYI